jgi:hypothetical protein
VLLVRAVVVGDGEAVLVVVVVELEVVAAVVDA